MNAGGDQGGFLGVCIYPDLKVRMLAPGNSFNEVAEQVEAPLKEYKLLEENVETLLVCAFQHVFRDFDLMLISRERPLLKVADLIAVDRMGRLTVFEVKRDKPNSVEIVAQAMRYLVECASLTPAEIKRLFRDFYRHFSVFQVLSFAGLLVKCGVERGLKSYLKSRLPEDEGRKLELLSNKGGDEYFNHLKDLSIKHILRPRGVDIESVSERLLKQATGINDLSPSELEKSLNFDRMFERRFKIKTENVDINRQWRIVFFAPAYSFNHEIRRYLTWMYIRGMDMLFYEYRLMASSENGPWLLSWRKRRDWLDGKLIKKKANKSFTQWKTIEGWLNDFAVKTAKKGYTIKKMTGCYEYWNVIKPDLEAISVRWPDDRQARKLWMGKIIIKGTSQTDYHALNNKLLAVRNKYNAKIKEINVQSRNCDMIIKWESSSRSPEDCVEIASRVVVEVLETLKTNLTDHYVGE